MKIFKKIVLLFLALFIFSNNFCMAYDVIDDQLNLNSTSQISDLGRTITQEISSTQPSTIVTNTSSTSNTTTLSNILDIALIVIGFLLILLAIAILIRLH